MENNAFINSNLTLKYFIYNLEARITVRIFNSKTMLSIKAGAVYEILADRDFLETYGDYSIKGLNLGGIGNGLNILIEKKEV